MVYWPLSASFIFLGSQAVKQSPKCLKPLTDSYPTDKEARKFIGQSTQANQRIDFTVGIDKEKFNKTS